MTNEKLEKQIEELIRAHLATCHKTIAAAVERAFVAAVSNPAGRRQPAKAAKPATSRSKSSPRRSSEEMAALGQRFYEAVCANPGETMALLAPKLETTARKLSRPVARLKREGRIRCVGERNHTRYFPMVTEVKVEKMAVKAA